MNDIQAPTAPEAESTDPEMDRAANPVLVEATRGAMVESRHRGAFAVVDVEGRVIASAGDTERPIYARSAIKPLQAIPLVESGAAEAFGLGDGEIALACASHRGEPRHVEAVTAWLARIGCSVADLECGTHPPSDPAALAELLGARGTPHAAHNNCSGKHAGFLTLARHLGLPTQGYIRLEHGVQQRVLGTLEAMTGLTLGAAPRGIDGCGIPVIAVPLGNLARAMARLADPADQPEPRQAACARIRAAMAAEPFMISGTGRFCTRVIAETGGRALVKTGAEGVYCAALPGARGHGLGRGLATPWASRSRSTTARDAPRRSPWPGCWSASACSTPNTSSARRASLIAPAPWWVSCARPPAARFEPRGAGGIIMRAVLCEAWGEPQVLRLGEVEVPAPGPGEVRLAVHAAGVNFADILMVAGQYQEKPAFPFTPGLEAAGVVEAVGEGVSRVAPGDRVLALPATGAFAEAALAGEDSVFKIPDAMDFITAAGFAVAYGTAQGALDWRAHLRPGELLLVHGAAGGAGLAAVEVGKAMGATVIATARGPEKLAVAREHGADHLIDTGSEDVRAEVRRIAGELGKQGAEVVFDPVGGALFEASLRCVAWGARLVVIGFAGGKVQQIPANILLVKNVSAIGFYWGSYRARAPELVASGYARLFAWYAAGKLRPHVSQQLDLAEAGAALELLKSRKSTGKVVLTTGRT